MKIAYLHGLESKAGGKKVEWLSQHADVYAPALNYKNSSTFNQVFNEIKKFNPDVIIGSSMGGWFSYLIGSKLGIHTILFNPAVTGRSFDPSVDDSALKGTFNTVIQGTNDTTIIPKDVKEWLGIKGKGSFSFDTYNGEHKVPFVVFKDKVSKILGIKETKILSFTEFVNEGYYKNLAPSTVAKKKAMMKQQAEMPDDDPDAYKELPGDTKGKKFLKTSAHTKKYHELFGDNEDVNESLEGDMSPIDNADIEKALKTKSEETGVPVKFLRIVMRRGMAAWKSGHRPGAGQEQWGYARISSFLTQAPGTWVRPINDPKRAYSKNAYGADADVAQEVIKGGHDKNLKK
jgi:hypothetical protein